MSGYDMATMVIITFVALLLLVVTYSMSKTIEKQQEELSQLQQEKELAYGEDPIPTLNQIIQDE